MGHWKVCMCMIVHLIDATKQNTAQSDISLIEAVHSCHLWHDELHVLRYNIIIITSTSLKFEYDFHTREMCL